MGHYLLATYGVDTGAPRPNSPEEMQVFMGRIIELEAEMDATNTFVFGGALHGADAATVVSQGAGGAVTTDGPFVESKEHIAGFYIISADDLDAALKWADKVSQATGQPIEVRPFHATGRVADHVSQMPNG